MDIKLEKMEKIKQYMSQASEKSLLICLDRVVDILSFLDCLYDYDLKDNIVQNKLDDLREKGDFIYYKGVELTLQKNVSGQVLIEILTNLLINSIDRSEEVLVDYITTLAFSSFYSGLFGEGYNVHLTDYLLSNFRIDFLIKHWDKIEESTGNFN